MTRSVSNRVKLGLFDVCGTLLAINTITDFTDHFLLSRKRNKAYKFSTPIKHKLWNLYTSFYQPSTAVDRRHLVRLYRGYAQEQVSTLAQEYTTRLFSFLKPEIKQELDRLKNSGYLIYLVSAGLDVYLKPFAESFQVGLICTDLEKNSSGIYTGKIKGIDCYGKGKVEKLRNELIFFSDVDWENSVAFGDNLSDVPLLSLVGRAYVVDPSGEMKNFAHQHNWPIIKTTI